MAKIIIIDDSSSVRTQLGEVLRGAGHTVIEAVDGMEGYEKIVENQPCDLIISDYNMPGEDGISMLQRVGEDLPGVKLPIFMLTTETSESLKVEGKTVGVIAWIVKPFVAEKLLLAVKKITERNK